MLAIIFSALSVLSASAAMPPAYAPPPVGGYGGYSPVHMPGDGAGCARRWEPCAGGPAYNGSTCCVGFNVCKRQNEYFGLCVPLEPMPDGYVAEHRACEPGAWPTCEPLTECKPNPGPWNVTVCLDPVHERKREHDCSKADRYAQCGGATWTGPHTCRGQNYCKFVNDYWSMCVPLEDATDAGCAAKYAACGGRNYKGPGCCADGLTCDYVNEWYSHCV